MTGCLKCAGQSNIPFMLNQHQWIVELQFTVLLNQPLKHPFLRRYLIHILYIYTCSVLGIEKANMQLKITIIMYTGSCILFIHTVGLVRSWNDQDFYVLPVQ